MELKWHKNCGGTVVYREGLPEDNFGHAGFCLKCDAFPLLQEEIIFQLENGKYERLNDKDKKWEILDRNQLKENIKQ